MKDNRQRTAWRHSRETPDIISTSLFRPIDHFPHARREHMMHMHIPSISVNTEYILAGGSDFPQHYVLIIVSTFRLVYIHRELTNNSIRRTPTSILMRLVVKNTFPSMAYYYLSSLDFPMPTCLP